VGGDHVDRGQDWLYAGDVASLGTPARARYGQRPGPTTAEEERVKALEREVRMANEILRLASTFFAQAKLGRHFKP
jgi:transposase-like protein